MKISLFADHGPLSVDASVHNNCAEKGIDVRIFTALIQQESGFDPWATRFEPHYYERHLKNKNKTELVGYVPLLIPTFRTECTHRATSWGLCQILGDTARGLGFKGRFLSQLLQPEVNIGLGTSYFAMLLKRVKEEDKITKYRTALLRWNGGGDLSYPDKVFGHIQSDQFNAIIKGM